MNGGKLLRAVAYIIWKDKMNEKEWLERVRLGAKVYNEGRLHRDFQAAEVDKFIEWLYKQYGVVIPKDPL